MSKEMKDKIFSCETKKDLFDLISREYNTDEKLTRLEKNLILQFWPKVERVFENYFGLKKR